MRAVTNRVFLCLACVIWICIASTLCGCNQTAGFMNNRAGMSAYYHGDFAAARRSFEMALADNPHSAHYAFNLAASMRRQGDVLAAERMYKQALTLDPGHQPAYHGMAAMLMDQGRDGEAEELLTAWNATQPYRAESHVELAWWQQERGDLAGAEDSLRRALQVNPRHPAALAHLGQIYEQTGRGPEAMGMYQRSLVMNPYQPQVRSQLAQAQQPYRADPPYQTATPMPYPTMQPAAPAIPQTAWSMPPQYPTMPAAPTIPQTAYSHPPQYAPQVQATWPQPGGMPQVGGFSSIPAGPVQYGTAPATLPQTAHYGALLPAPNADPAHVPMMSAVQPAVPAF